MDAASLGSLMESAKKRFSVCHCLYTGDSEKSLGRVAPYLCAVQSKADIRSWYLEQGCGRSWGVWVVSAAGFDDCWKHFRKFLIVKAEGGKDLYFRFYDPRVLNIFLPTCDRHQLEEFFGPVKAFIAEDGKSGQVFRYELKDGNLVKQVQPMGQIFENDAKLVSG